jgi:hypothetical protein
MKKVLMITTAILIISAGLVSFTSSKSDFLSKDTLVIEQQTASFKPKVKVKLRWRGIGGPGNSCWKTTADCGDCFGLCILIQWNQPNSLTQQEIDDGYSYAYIELDTISYVPKLTFEPEATMDDGSGKVTITNDFFIGTYASELLGVESVTIKTGEYTIDYNKGVGFGQVVFNTEVIY